MTATRALFVAALFGILQGCASPAHGPVAEERSSESLVADGLRSLLARAASGALDQLAKKDGWKGHAAPFPPDAAQIVRPLENLGMKPQLDAYVESLQLALRLASAEARPIVTKTTTEMLFSAPSAVRDGAATAATDDFRRVWEAPLMLRLEPAMRKAMAQAKVGEKWKPLVQAYNSLPILTKLEYDVAPFLTDHFSDVFFLRMAEEETRVRGTPGPWAAAE